MKVLGIYHSRDLDGLCSGAIIKHYYPQADMVGYDYNESTLDIINISSEYDLIIIADVSLPMVDMAIVHHYCKNLLFIDHHKSVKEDFDKFYEKTAVPEGFTYIYEEGTAACELCWNYFFPMKKMPLAVSLLGAYDVWRESTPDYNRKGIELFQLYMVSGKQSLMSMQNIFTWDKLDIEKKMLIGAEIKQYRDSLTAKAAKFSFERNFHGHKAICLNTTRPAGSWFFDGVENLQDYDLMIAFTFTGKGWIYSLYRINESLDMSVLAKKHLGGGHAGAAGFSLNYFVLKEE